jgi:hypothetical protein
VQGQILSGASVCNTIQLSLVADHLLPAGDFVGLFRRGLKSTRQKLVHVLEDFRILNRSLHQCSSNHIERLGYQHCTLCLAAVATQFDDFLAEEVNFPLPIFVGHDAIVTVAGVEIKAVHSKSQHDRDADAFLYVRVSRGRGQSSPDNRQHLSKHQLTQSHLLEGRHQIRLLRG